MLPEGSSIGKSRADRGGHGLLDQVDFAGARAIGGVLHGAFFHRRDFAGHADDDARMHEHAPVVRLLDEVGEHFFGHLEIGDDAVLHRLDGHDVARRAAEHVLGFLADGHDFAAVLVDGHDRRLVHDDALALGVDQRVGRAQIDRQVGRKQTEDRAKVVTVLVHAFPQCRVAPAACGCRVREGAARLPHLCALRTGFPVTELQFPRV